MSIKQIPAKQKNLWISKIANIVDKAVISSTFESEGFERIFQISSMGLNFYLVGEAIDDYDELVKSMLAYNDWGDKYSEDFIGKQLQTLLGAILSENKREEIGKYLDDIIKSLLEFNEEYELYVPLDGITSQLSELEMGSCRLVSMDEERIQILLDRSEAIMMQSEGSEDQKHLLADFAKTSMAANLSRRVCVVYKALAEPVRAFERAEAEARRILDLIRFVIPALIPDDLRSQVGFQGEVFSSQRFVPIFGKNDSYFSLQSNRVGPLAVFVLNSQTVGIMRDMGIMDVAEILKKTKNQSTEFEQMILRSIHWFANAQVQTELENKLLSLVTCLETFLTPRDSSPIILNISEGVAILLENGVTERIRIKRKIRDLYGKRSAVSHGSSKAVLDLDISELTEISGSLITHMIRRRGEFTTHQSLFDWIEAQKLS